MKTAKKRSAQYVFLSFYKLNTDLILNYITTFL